ncbi:hypothetical protein FPCIR_2 [Fusarium pseudocircinatum]|uniref:Uncharacterized protein n=1 Tax=Fusarium pseudocircinatum TaxID=56676 RepID=A0A8H5Q1C4_9HYPO|nr:hypothetical protein FPCIR_2 [Fusarium pseudocircinatum]
MWLFLFLALRYGVTIERIPNPERRRGANIRRQGGEIQLDILCMADFEITAGVPLSDVVTKYHSANHSLRLLFAPTEFGTLCTCW